MNREHDTIEEGHPACQEEEFLELPLLLSSRHLAALKTAAFRQGVTVGRLLRRLIRDYLAVLRERGLESETRRSHALAERFDSMFLRNRTGVGPRDRLIPASEVFSELPRSGTGTNGLERSPRMLPANAEAERSSRPTEVARDRPETANNHPRANQALALLAHELRNPLGMRLAGTRSHKKTPTGRPYSTLTAENGEYHEESQRSGGNGTTDTGRQIGRNYRPGRVLTSGRRERILGLVISLCSLTP